MPAAGLYDIHPALCMEVCCNASCRSLHGIHATGSCGWACGLALQQQIEHVSCTNLCCHLQTQLYAANSSCCPWLASNRQPHAEYTKCFKATAPHTAATETAMVLKLVAVCLCRVCPAAPTAPSSLAVAAGGWTCCCQHSLQQTTCIEQWCVCSGSMTAARLAAQSGSTSALLAMGPICSSSCLSTGSMTTKQTLSSSVLAAAQHQH